MVGGVIREFVNDTDRPAFLERELVGLGVDGYQSIRVQDRASGPVPIYMFWEHLTCVSHVKNVMHFTLDKRADALETCKWTPVHFHGRELWPIGTHPYLIPSDPFPGMLVCPCHSQTPRCHPCPCLPPIWNSTSTRFKILLIPRYQHPISSLSLPHPYFPFPP